MKDIEKNNEAFKALFFVSRRIAELEAESERIKAENAKLRELAQYILDENYGDDWFNEKAEEIGLEAVTDNFEIEGSL